MEFLKKYWSKLVLAIAMVAGAAMAIVPIFTMGTFQVLGLFQILGIVLFFLGMATYYILKMVEVKKLVAAVALLTTGVLSLISFTIGFFGISTAPSTNEDDFLGKAKGPFGAAYAMPYALAGMEMGGAGEGIAQMGELAASLEQKDADKLTKALENFNKKYEKFNDKTPASTRVSTTLAFMKEVRGIIKNAKTNASFTSEVQKEMLENFDKGIEPVADLQTAALTMLFTYISLMLVMGLVPAVVGTKKLVCALGKCDCCGSSAPVKAAAPVAYSSAPVAAPAAPVAKPVAPKAPVKK